MEIYYRVCVDKDMPPDGPLSDQQQSMIAAWAGKANPLPSNPKEEK
jgi:hypothetical protein